MGLSEEINAVDYVALAIMAMNIASSVGIVFFNKWLFQYLSFSFSYSLVLFHFGFTSIGLGLCFLTKVFTFKRIPILAILPLSASFCGFVLLTNISLQYNSVGFYQICKVLTTPMIMLIHLVIFKKTHSTGTVITLAIVCVGVIITTTTDVETNVYGTIIALCGVLVTSFYQIWVGTYQKTYEVNSPQLLMYQAPISCVMLLLAWPWMESTNDFWEYDFQDTEFLIVLGLSCFAALFVNLSTFLLIGRTSPLTYNAVGHFKLILILSGGYILFGQLISLGNLIGVFVTLFGLFGYTRVKLQEQAKSIEEENKQDIIPTKVLQIDENVGKSSPQDNV